jgi:hypothetical protein
VSTMRKTGPQTRRDYHEGRIRDAKGGVKRLFLAAQWVVSELNALGRRDPAKANAQGLALADQLITFAGRLNEAHHQHLMQKKGGRGA